MSAFDLLDSEALGRKMGLGDPARPGTASRAINVRIMRGHPMPPSIQLPGMRGRRWRASVVDAWLVAFEGATRLRGSVARKGGRPRKEEWDPAQRRL